jgi:hypothetical protein
VQGRAVAQGLLGGGIGVLVVALGILENWSVVATRFSISELSLASSRGMVLMSIVWFGIRRAACFNPARAARAATQRLRTPLVSSSALGGKAGSSFQGRSGLQPVSNVMLSKIDYCDMF